MVWIVLSEWGMELVAQAMTKRRELLAGLVVGLSLQAPRGQVAAHIVRHSSAFRPGVMAGRPVRLPGALGRLASQADRRQVTVTSGAGSPRDADGRKVELAQVLETVRKAGGAGGQGVTASGQHRPGMAELVGQKMIAPAWRRDGRFRQQRAQRGHRAMAHPVLPDAGRRVEPVVRQQAVAVLGHQVDCLDEV